MAKTLAGVRYGKLTSYPKERTYPGVGKGRSGPPMVDIGSKQGQQKIVQPKRKAGGGRFARAGSVSTRNSHSGDQHIPMIGKQTGHGNWATHGIRKSH